MNIRESIEQMEKQNLCSAAVLVCESRGRAVPEDKCPLRTDFQRDRDRIIHSNAFRRLKHKTQVYLAPEGDHYRTRLTHTLEVSQIARTIARALRLNEDLTEAISLGHDLGHTPFGHAGERALNDVAAAGFRHYEQSLRIVDKLEKDGYGLNLTAEVRDGILCHTKGTEAFTAEGRIVRIADHIAYMNHDIDDSIRAGVLTEDDIPREVSSVLGIGHAARINALITDLVQHSENGNIAFSDRFRRAYDILHEFLFDSVYRNKVVKGEESKVEAMIKHLFEHYLMYPEQLPGDYAGTRLAEGDERAILDYISGMSDRYAVNQFMSLTVPRSWDR
ncbi:MAG: deoxyguanosinetriphosphate triphosphohydrolase [Ruminococcaceae bacterium]|nr:deoxyguanosinetriphosphate triphosphohydrolase [Oscillospiraceae bacterium]